MIDLKTLKELVKLMVNNDLTELDLQDKEEQVSLKRGGGEQTVHYVPSSPPSAASPVAPAPGGGDAAGAASSAGGAKGADTGATEGDEELIAITSPMVGTFYAASSPDAEPFASVGSKVDHETVVCLVEAMKVFNEIKAETKGVIEKVLVENGEAVEFGQPLFLVRP